MSSFQMNYGEYLVFSYTYDSYAQLRESLRRKQNYILLEDEESSSAFSTITFQKSGGEEFRLAFIHDSYFPPTLILGGPETIVASAYGHSIAVIDVEKRCMLFRQNLDTQIVFGRFCRNKLIVIAEIEIASFNMQGEILKRHNTHGVIDAFTFKDDEIGYSLLDDETERTFTIRLW